MTAQRLPRYSEAEATATAALSSPEHVQMSLAAAMVLGLRPGLFLHGAHTRCLNLLLTYPRGCAANCAYCGLARDRAGSYSDKSFIRVPWPTVALDEVIERSKERTHLLERMCVSMITQQGSNRDTLEIVRRWTAEPALASVPVSILSNPTTMQRQDLIDLRDAGAERFTVALDAVTAELFEATRGSGVRGPHRFEDYWRVYDLAHEVFGADAIGVHLICGMGETERELVEAMARARQKGAYGCLQLFAFNPEAGSRMQGRGRVPLGQFRRAQLSRYLLDKGLVTADALRFNDRGQIANFGLPAVELEGIIDSGTAFRTSGCPGRECDVSACNRPFGDGPPSDFSSFPYAPQRRDIERIKLQLEDYEGRIEREEVAQQYMDELEDVLMHPCRG
ncbi:MAG: radical SAM protein [Myxococcales bacterium]|nr:radical SAM protein [Myxococcales bacterium]